MGKQVVGLKGNSSRETEVQCQYSSASLAVFIGVSCFMPSPLLVEGGQLCLVHRAS